jgi:hypothetical protein
MWDVRRFGRSGTGQWGNGCGRKDKVGRYCLETRAQRRLQLLIFVVVEAMLLHLQLRLLQQRWELWRRLWLLARARRRGDGFVHFVCHLCIVVVIIIIMSQPGVPIRRLLYPERLCCCPAGCDCSLQLVCFVVVASSATALGQDSGRAFRTPLGSGPRDVVHDVFIYRAT